MATYFGSVGGKEYRILPKDDGTFLIDGEDKGIGLSSLGNGRYSVLVKGRSFSISVSGSDQDRSFLVNGKLVTVVVESERSRMLRKLNAGSGDERGALEIRAPMPALVSSVPVNVGDAVKAGQGLIILEAMKMENEIKAHRNGIVEKVLVSKGKSVEKGELLLVLEGKHTMNASDEGISDD